MSNRRTFSPLRASNRRTAVPLCAESHCVKSSCVPGSLLTAISFGIISFLLIIPLYKNTDDIFGRIGHKYSILEQKLALTYMHNRKADLVFKLRIGYDIAVNIRGQNNNLLRLKPLYASDSVAKNSCLFKFHTFAQLIHLKLKLIYNTSVISVQKGYRLINICPIFIGGNLSRTDTDTFSYMIIETRTKLIKITRKDMFTAVKTEYGIYCTNNFPYRF